jgi:hypothetical protein
MPLPAVLVGISWCGSHAKGAVAGSPGAVMVGAKDHMEWLLEAVSLYQGIARGLGRHPDRREARVVVTASALLPILQVPTGAERDLLWEVMKRVTVLASPEDADHQIGASITLRQGLECAGYWGYPYYVHTAEDIIPWPGSVRAMLADLDAGADYSGFRWSDSVNTAFFASRTAALAGVFDVGAVRGYPGLEHYLASLLAGKVSVNQYQTGNPRHYIHTHDYAQYRRWRSRMPRRHDVPSVVSAADYERLKDYLASEPG